MLDALFRSPAATAVTAALSSAGAATGPIAIARDPRLVRALAAPDREVIAVGLSPRAAKRLAGPRARAEVGELAARSLAAAVVSNITADDDWQRSLAQWLERIRDGGALVLVDRGRAAEASRRALCAGLCELEQRVVGRAVVTSGLVTHL